MLLYVYILTNVCSSLIPHTHKVITWRNDHLGVTPRWWLEDSKPKIHRLHHILGTLDQSLKINNWIINIIYGKITLTSLKAC